MADGAVGTGAGADAGANGAALAESAFAVSGMFCGGCAATVERALRRLPGVADVSVSFLSDSAFVRHDPSRIARAALAARLAEIGYETRAIGERDARAVQGAFEKSHRIRLAIALGFGMWVMLAVIARYFTELPNEAYAWWLSVASGVFSLPVLLYSGWAFHRLGWRGLRAGVPGMESLILVATLAAAGVSVHNLANGIADTWFEVPVMLIAFQLIARLGDVGARRRAADAVRSMLDLSPERVRRVEASVGQDGQDGQGESGESGESKEESGESGAVRPPGGSVRSARSEARVPERLVDVAVSDLSAGDLIESRAGERFAADGTVESGTALVDTALLSGESLPRAVGAGDAVLAGTMNVDGTLRVRVTAAGGERTLDRLAATVGRALHGKSDLMRLIDRAAGSLIPLIGAASGVAFALALAGGASVPDALVRALATLVVSCPCALSLAVPLVVSTTAANAAREGIVLRDAAALERADRIDTVLLDKTGTLTTGQPAVARVVTAPGTTEARVLAFAAVAERGSNHPLARAVRRHAVAVGAIVERSEANEGGPTGGMSGDSGSEASGGASGRYGSGSGRVADGKANGESGSRSGGLADRKANGRSGSLTGGDTEESVTDDVLRVLDRHERAGAGVRASLADGRQLLAGSAAWLAEHGIERLPDVGDASCSRVLVAVGGVAIGAIELTDTPRDDAAPLLEALRARGLEPVLASGDTAGAAAALAERFALPWHAPLDPDGKRALVESLQRDGRRVAFVGDGLNDAPALAVADLGIATGEASDLARSAAAMSVLNGGLERVDIALALARRASRTLSRNLALAIGYNALLLPAAVLGFLHPVAAVIAMAASSLSVSASSLTLVRRVRTPTSWREAGDPVARAPLSGSTP